MIASTLEDMLEQGFTRRMAQSYLKALEWERECGLFDADALAWAHERGFRAESLSGYDLLEHRLEDYLSDYDYARLWPLNSWQRLWINDKLTLKYLLAGTDMDRYLPAYYYYTSPDSAGGIPAPAAAATAAPAAAPGRLVPLSDSEMDPTIRGFLAQLKRVGAFACKPCNGEGASGFHELAYTQGAWQVDGEEVGRMGVEQFVASHSNYVFTELIRPASQLARVSPAIHTLRLLVLNPDGARPSPVANYLRFAVKAGTQGTKANYRAPIDESMCSYNCTVDFATGRIGGARLVPKHKDWNEDLVALCMQQQEQEAAQCQTMSGI